MGNPYSTDKIIHHPDALEAMRQRRHQPPTQIHFMPALACQQRCRWCAYGHRAPGDGPEAQGWKNMQLMSGAHMPRAKMLECLRDWEAMGVRAVEVTGGGEPLVYPYIRDLFGGLTLWGVDVALVTNGVAMAPDMADAFTACNWLWARVSIDAGAADTYQKVRRVPADHWRKAWRALRLLADRVSHDEQRVGAGFVVDAGNWGEVYAFCRLAHEHGADNVRISAAFTPAGLGRFPAGALEAAADQAKAAADDFPGLQVNCLVSERASNLAAPAQDYQFCGAKEVTCVVGGDSQVYTCCTLAFNEAGLIGDIEGRSFIDLWEAPETRAFFAGHDARQRCRVECLYEKRNRRILGLIDMSEAEVYALRLQMPQPVHKNFI